MTVSVDVDRLRRAIALFHAGRVEFIRLMCAEDIVWRVPHTHPLAADLIGVDAVMDFMRRVQKETRGTFSAEPIEMAVTGRSVFCLLRVSGQRGDRVLDQRAVLLWWLGEDNKIRERELFMENPAAADEFWSFDPV
ncbi:MAG TPA: nuclear transport factor 2 family protein [Candidatus Limnocylindrales bacterium]|nr:nuclear transport factor 2 family protein [Candidatus Limnocylindrales bacterium]